MEEFEGKSGKYFQYILDGKLIESGSYTNAINLLSLIGFQEQYVKRTGELTKKFEGSALALSLIHTFLRW